VEKEQVMKKVMTIVVVLCIACAAQASYTYTFGIGTDFGSLDLNGHESALVNGGGGDRLTLFDWTSARVDSTSHLVYPYFGGHGIPEIDALGYSNLMITGGEVGELHLGNYGKATISGGTIEYLYGQLAGSIPAIPADKYIQFVCKSYSYSPGTKKLNGVWADDSLFNIQLVDTNPWPSGFTYDSINFTVVPEPLSLGLLALGGLLVRRHRRY
jgi:hypothetical protein